MLDTTNTIEIWAPRFSDRKVLIAPWKVVSGLNRIVFTRTKMPSLLINGAEIKKYPMETNGKIGCHAVPISAFAKESETKQVRMQV